MAIFQRIGDDIMISLESKEAQNSLNSLSH